MTETLRQENAATIQRRPSQMPQLPVKPLIRSQQMDFHAPFDGAAPESNRASVDATPHRF
jgi:hypothetical protein